MGWDYARFSWSADGGTVSFTCQEAWTNISKNQVMAVLTDLGAMSWELISFSSDIDVYGHTTMMGGTTSTSSTQYMLFKRPWKEGGREGHVQHQAEWIFRTVSRIEMDRAQELAEYALEEEIPTWKLPEMAPTFLTKEEREKEKGLSPAERRKRREQRELRGW